ncbi:hypothetical protein KIW84_013284 [Lathyrus oleraceus]|uniref:Pentatricopeptide repeat-containing protein n=1 Tax=Pisum sativum TaxID=3888 RepID=A0A9D5GXK0_PEA|nr:hypothetical protein KIW84_013284 [Pisum sativum]
MIAGYDGSGHPEESLSLFRRMIRTETKSNGATLATTLSAYADLGSLNIGQEIEEYVFEHRFQLVQLVQMSLGRVGQLDLPLDTIQAIPPEVQAEAFGPLLNTCRIHDMQLPIY